MIRDDNNKALYELAKLYVKAADQEALELVNASAHYLNMTEAQFNAAGEALGVDYILRDDLNNFEYQEVIKNITGNRYHIFYLDKENRLYYQGYPSDKYSQYINLYNYLYKLGFEVL